MKRRLGKRHSRSRWTKYGFAVSVAALALLIRFPLAPSLGAKVPYLTFFLATAASAVFGGFGPGVVTTVLGALFTVFWMTPGPLKFAGVDEYLGLARFLVGGGVISYLTGSLREARSHEAALRQYFQQTLLSIGDAVISTDDDRRVLLMNRTAEELTGWTLAEAKGKAIEEVFRVVQEGADPPIEIPIERRVDAGTSAELANHMELITRKGDRVPIEDVGAAIKDEYGVSAGMVLVFRDITERKRGELALHRLNEDLKQFTYAATHDLREPLRMMTVSAQMLKRKLATQLDQESCRYVADIITGGQRISRLIDALLKFSRLGEIDQGQPKPVNAEAALIEALMDLQVAIDETHATVVHSKLPNVLGSHAQVRQLFQNLVGNAIKYRRAGVRPDVHVSAKREGDDWIFSVRDNGIGIDPAYRDQIFIPFKRLHGPEIAGSGIGLATCKRIVELYGGRIWVEPHPQAGSILSFSLHAAEEAGYAAS